MLTEPTPDAKRLSLDRGLIEAMRARLSAGEADTADVRALEMRETLRGLPPVEREAARALWGRLRIAAGTRIVAAGPRARILAADRFGSGVDVAIDPASALAHVGPGVSALIDLGDTAWWGRLLALPGLRVVEALPDDGSALPQALMVGVEPVGPSGDDRTFWVTDSAQTDARIVSALSGDGLAARLLTASGGLKLYALAGYVQPEDGRLTNAPGSLSGVIGSAPIY